MGKKLKKSNTKVNIENFTLISVLFLLVNLLQIFQVHCTECGKVNSIEDLIIDGTKSIIERWPFVVVIHQLNNSEYLCGGTLISMKHILSGKS